MHPSTFSIVAHERQTGEFGVAVASKFLAVGVVVPWARAGVGALATQAWANLSYDPEGLRLLEGGAPADAVVEQLTAADEDRQRRQPGVVDAQGRTAAWTGGECTPWAGHRGGESFTCQGNILAGPQVVEAMADAFERTEGEFSERLVAALAAGQGAGGDSRGQQSAALLVVKEKGSYGGYLDRYIDLRVDDHLTPIIELGRLLDLHRLYFVSGERVFTRLTGPSSARFKRSCGDSATMAAKRPATTVRRRKRPFAGSSGWKTSRNAGGTTIRSIARSSPTCAGATVALRPRTR